jgi:hypothetical protein
MGAVHIETIASVVGHEKARNTHEHSQHTSKKEMAGNTPAIDVNNP